MSSQTRERFEQLLDRASSLGIDPAKVAAAGPPALRALLALTQAKDSEAGPQRERHLAKVQDILHILQHREHPELVQQIQKAVVALHGRESDTEIAHVTRGEIVVPLQLQNAEVVAALRRAAEPYGVPLDMLRVGTVLNRINPKPVRQSSGSSTGSRGCSRMTARNLHHPQTKQGPRLPSLRHSTIPPSRRKKRKPSMSIFGNFRRSAIPFSATSTESWNRSING